METPTCSLVSLRDYLSFGSRLWNEWSWVITSDDRSRHSSQLLSDSATCSWLPPIGCGSNLGLMRKLLQLNHLWPRLPRFLKAGAALCQMCWHIILRKTCVCVCVCVKNVRIQQECRVVSLRSSHHNVSSSFPLFVFFICLLDFSLQFPMCSF